jgi:peroxiredoxin
MGSRDMGEGARGIHDQSVCVSQRLRGHAWKGMHEMKKVMIATLLLLVAFGAAAGAMVGYQLGMFDDPKAEVAIGDTLPAFELQDAEGNTHRLSDYTGQILVIIFCSQHCPFSVGVDPDLAVLAEQYADENVAFLGIDSHHSTTPDAIAAYATEKRLPYPTLKDPGNAYADQLGAKRTPEIFIVDTEGTLVYHGAFDSRRGTTSPGSTPYTADALAALVAGETIPTPETRAWGCSIKRAEP